jgi:hypothetical protein
MATNWKPWVDRLTAELWEAICLSLDLEPLRPASYNYLRSGKPPTFVYPTAAIEKEFNRRVEVARDHMIAGSLPVVAHGENDWTARVELHSFRLWAESLKTPWTLPEEFPRKPLSHAAPKSESVPERNLRWARLEAKEKKANPSTGVTLIARGIAEAEGLPFDRVKRGIQTGRKILAELTRQGNISKPPASALGSWPAARPGKSRR